MHRCAASRVPPSEMISGTLMPAQRPHRMASSSLHDPGVTVSEVFLPASVERLSFHGAEAGHAEDGVRLYLQPARRNVRAALPAASIISCPYQLQRAFDPAQFLNVRCFTSSARSCAHSMAAWSARSADVSDMSDAARERAVLFKSIARWRSNCLPNSRCGMTGRPEPGLGADVRLLCEEPV